MMVISQQKRVKKPIKIFVEGIGSASLSYINSFFSKAGEIIQIKRQDSLVIIEFKYEQSLTKAMKFKGRILGDGDPICIGIVNQQIKGQKIEKQMVSQDRIVKSIQQSTLQQIWNSLSLKYKQSMDKTRFQTELHKQLALLLCLYGIKFKNIFHLHLYQTNTMADSLEISLIEFLTKTKYQKSALSSKIKYYTLEKCKQHQIVQIVSIIKPYSLPFPQQQVKLQCAINQKQNTLKLKFKQFSGLYQQIQSIQRVKSQLFRQLCQAQQTTIKAIYDVIQSPFTGLLSYLPLTEIFNEFKQYLDFNNYFIFYEYNSSTKFTFIPVPQIVQCDMMLKIPQQSNQSLSQMDFLKIYSFSVENNWEEVKCLVNLSGYNFIFDIINRKYSVNYINKVIQTYFIAKGIQEQGRSIRIILVDLVSTFQNQNNIFNESLDILSKYGNIIKIQLKNSQTMVKHIGKILIDQFIDEQNQDLNALEGLQLNERVKSLSKQFTKTYPQAYLIQQSGQNYQQINEGQVLQQDKYLDSQKKSLKKIIINSIRGLGQRKAKQKVYKYIKNIRQKQRQRGDENDKANKKKKEKQLNLWKDKSIDSNDQDNFRSRSR